MLCCSSFFVGAEREAEVLATIEKISRLQSVGELHKCWINDAMNDSKTWDEFRDAIDWLTMGAQPARVV